MVRGGQGRFRSIILENGERGASKEFARLGSGNKMEAMGLDENLRDWLKMDLADILQGKMPFGKFGPVHFPPSGVPLFDLPVEYLEWFARKGFPKGRLGELLKIVHQLKVDGCDEIFDEARRKRGGRTSLRDKG